jgi:hypothetical protein
MKLKLAPDPVGPARDFTAAYRALKKSLVGDRELFDAYYVRRTDSPVEELKSRLLVDNEDCHTLYLGTRKSGKTTELGRLAYELDDRFLVVFISVLSDMEPSDVKPIDLLLFTLAKLTSVALKAGVKVGREVEKDIADWLLQNTNEVFRTKVSETGGVAKVGAKLNAVVAELNASFGVDSKLRTEVREKLGPRVAEIAAHAEVIAAKVRQSLKKDPLIIIDDIEKIDLADQEELFGKHAATLTRPQVRTIYTADKALVYLPSWNLIRASFPQPAEVRSLATVKRDGSRHGEGLALLRNLLLKRVHESLFEPDALRKLTEVCNGVMGDLLEVTQTCCTSAMADKAPKITWNMVDRCFQSLSDTFRRMIAETEYPRLAEIHQKREAKNDAGLGELLFMHAVIEYRDERGLYYDVHPAVVPILRQKKLIPA